MRNKLYNYLVILIIVEIVLGGLGNLFGLPIRKVFFIIGIFYTVYMIYRDKIKIEKKYIIPIGIIVFYVLYGSLVGLIRGNALSNIIADANSFLGILYILLFIVYFKGDFKRINFVMDIVINCSVIVAIMTIGLFFFSRLYLPYDVSIIYKYEELNDILQYGFITGLVQSNSYARVYLFNGIFMEISALIIATRMLFPKNQIRNLDKFKLFILLLGIYTSTTRGYWLGLVAGFFILMCYYIWKRKEHNLVLKRFFIPLIAIIIVILLIPKTVDADFATNNEIAKGNGSAKDRVESMIDFQNNISNKIRIIQLGYLGEKIKESPLVGWGFGAEINEYKEYMEENNMPSVSSTNFELYYVELIYKTGILGGIVFFGYIIYKFIQLLVFMIKNKIDGDKEETLIAWTIAFMAFFISGVSNPYLASLCGIFVFVMESYILETIITK